MGKASSTASTSVVRHSRCRARGRRFSHSTASSTPSTTQSAASRQGWLTRNTIDSNTAHSNAPKTGRNVQPRLTCIRRQAGVARICRSARRRGFSGY